MIIRKERNEAVSVLKDGFTVEEKYNGSTANFAILKVNTSAENNDVTFANMSKFNFISWGDGDVTFPEDLTNSQPTHSYTKAGTYSIVITGVKVLNETQDNVSNWDGNRVFIDSDMALLTEIYFGLGVLYIDKNLTRPTTAPFTYFYLANNLKEIFNINEEDIFNDCSKLKNISFSEDVKLIKPQAFDSCNSLTSVEIPNGVTSIGDSTFSGCVSLTNVEIPDSVTSIGASAFSDCVSLAGVVIPNGVTSIEVSAFSGCSGLTSMVIPNGVTSIGDSAFNECKNLVSVEIPDSVTTIGDFAFYLCDGLSKIYYKGTDWSTITIGSNNTPLTIEKVYCYSETEPTEAGKYWHYNENGEPVIWPAVVAE